MPIQLERIFGQENMESHQTSIDGENTRFVGDDLNLAVLPPEDKPGYRTNVIVKSQYVKEFMDSFRDNMDPEKTDLQNLGGQCVYATYNCRELIGVRRVGMPLRRTVMHTGTDK